MFESGLGPLDWISDWGPDFMAQAITLTCRGAAAGTHVRFADTCSLDRGEASLDMRSA